MANCTGIFSPVNTWEKVPVAAWDDLGYSVYIPMGHIQNTDFKS